MPNETEQPKAASSSNKWIYIIIGVVAVLLVLWFMMRSASFMAMNAAGVNVTPNMDGSATYTATDGEGSVTVGGNKMPDSWPADAPQNFAGAQIQYSGTSNPQTGSAGAAVVYTVNASVATVIDHYKAQLTANGWTVENTANMGAASILSASKDSRTFGVSIVETGNGALQVSAGFNM